MQNLLNNKLLITAGVAITAGSYFYMRKPLGIRQNNPGNIRITGDAWVGLATNQPGEYFTFTDPVYGYRAMARILMNYQRRGIDTIQKIINTWAPSSENDTASYIEHVATLLATSPAEEIDVTSNHFVLAQLIEAIARHENGSRAWEKWHNKDMITAGITRA